MSNVSLKVKGSQDLPAFVRDDYATFTAFIDAYHAWLDINQADIKTLSDIDTTLESFIVNFRKEVDHKGIKFPNIDERFLLRHIKKLYLSKGTEESYRTLFKLLFNKDIILKYPDQMTMKLSDGKWEQLTSIFVETVAGDALSLKDHIVKIINPTTLVAKNVGIELVKLRRTGSGVSTIGIADGGTGYTSPTVTLSGGNGTGATAHAVVDAGIITSIIVDTPGSGYTAAPTCTITGSHTTAASIDAVHLYIMPDIYELNIDKHYYGNIEINDSVEYGSFVGKVLPTINSLTITNPGKNFRLGQTFNVDTFFGRGATVKVSKLIPGTYGIGELKFIEFGYGYISDFDSANIIPPNISQTVVPEGFVGFNGSFAEYSRPRPSGGYILDENYTVGVSGQLHNGVGTLISSPIAAPITLSGSWTSEGATTISNIVTLTGDWTINQVTAANDLYANDYSGNIVREFYSTNVYNGDPANGANVSFKIGAVCKYPGFYISSDGMPSDINKIQDSFLYQKYSYIIQVDEKLETYRDVVKSTIHPAGMALFGEFNITNNFYTPLKLTALLSIFAVSHADAVSAQELKYFDLSKEINDTTCGLLGIALDHATIYETIPVRSTLKTILDPNDFVTQSAETEYFTFVANKTDTVASSDSNTIDTSYSFTESLLLNNILSMDSITIQMDGDGLRIFETGYVSDINTIDSTVTVINDSLDSMSISDFGTITKNAYFSNPEEYVIGDYVSAPDSSFGQIFSPIESNISIYDALSSGAININNSGIVTLYGVWTLT